MAQLSFINELFGIPALTTSCFQNPLETSSAHTNFTI